MNVKRDLRSLVADIVIGGQGHVHLVTHALHVHDEHVRLLVDDPSAKMRDHPVVGGRYCRQFFGWGRLGNAGEA